MSLSDPLGDMIARIKNGYMARKIDVEIPYSGVKEALALVLKRYKYVGEVATNESKRKFTIKLLYNQSKPAITEISRISKPGLRQYAGIRDLGKFQSGLGFLILSTPKGIKTHIEAKKEKVGGELICRIW
ncbi:MAG: 30S ribosomal protein S8 [Candidatus Gottesmanbacteria bacterium GW2011_GWA1_34_13]|uniref:Small ribosomal subunit protein uS8 n=1 Tax=Candidatus Gottesmanbacteria bacterium GW2011_GWA1_34_13 TaxID=1618434 RepID=A0A0G0DXC5_9BACT|nr:MAG: 30S ribosomal protein S8 [Candidatus Gottesmanbacteria bacterium GW2011_GWA1_34_13]